MDAFHFFKPKWKFIFNIAGFFGIVGQFYMIMVAVFFCGYTQTQMPLQARFFPVPVPFAFCAWANKELHFHLLKFAHSKNKLPCHDLVTKCFAGLCNTKWDFHTCRFLHVKEIHKNTLCCFGAQVNGIGIFGHRTQLGREHQVKLADIGPVGTATHTANNFLVNDELA